MRARAAGLRRRAYGARGREDLEWRPVRAATVALCVASALLAGRALAFDLEGHRGARGLAPENTLAAFRTALKLGVTTIETDLAVTRDLQLVLSHDPKLNPDIVRSPDGRWLSGEGPALYSLTLEELRRYDVGMLNPASKYAAQWPAQQPSRPRLGHAARRQELGAQVMDQQVGELVDRDPAGVRLRVAGAQDGDLHRRLSRCDR
jgi:glycerophosphoryl diester phosphodiesterase